MRYLICSLVLVSSLYSQCTMSTPDYQRHLPEALEPWVDWVKWQHQELDCPFAYQTAERMCVWPGVLGLQITGKGGVFFQSITVYRKTSIVLPGGIGQWPENVQLDNDDVPVLSQNGKPVIELEPGVHQVTGGYAWKVLPESLALPAMTGIVLLRLDGKQIKYPLIKGGQIWLGKKTDRSAAKRPTDKLSLLVHRKLKDGHPFEITTHLRLQVSGQRREVVLGNPLLDGFVPINVRTGLPARLGSDGKLRVQVKPGQWELEVDAYHPGYLKQLTLPVQTDPWPEDEVWAFDARPEIRLVEITNGTQVDPRQTRLPSKWQQFPAYLVKQKETLDIKVIRSGDPIPDPDDLTLHRTMWLDFAGDGYTIQDRLQGKMTSGWRVSVDPSIQLGRVTLNGKPQLITQMNARDGVEVRRGSIDLQAESRLGGSRLIPVTGWGRDLQKVSAELNLPPGWRLIATSGVDVEYASWIKKWSLYDLFIVFVVAFGAGRLWGWQWAVSTLITLMLIWHEPDAPKGIWFYLLVIAALRRVISSGRIAGMLRSAWLAGVLALALIGLSFAIQQARTGLYPQLQLVAHHARAEQSPAVMARAQKQAVSADMAEDDAIEVGTIASTVSYYRESTRQKWLPDKNAKVQTGPGLPDWRWRRLSLGWDGPVTKSQQMLFILTGPRINLLLNLLQILLLSLLAWRFIDWSRRLRATEPASATGTAVGMMMMAMVSMGTAPDAMADDFPSAELLQELEQRITRAPDCQSRCADIARMRLFIQQNGFTLFIQVHSYEDTAIPVPMGALVPVGAWMDDSLVPVLQSGDQYHMRVPEGSHELGITGHMPNQNQISLTLPLPPRKMEISAKGWMVEGINPQGVPNEQLLLTRIAEAKAKQDGDKPDTSVLPPFVRIERTLKFGMDWLVENRLLRLSPIGTPVSVQVPLLAGELVVSDGFPVKDDKVLVALSPGARNINWQSRLTQSDRISLSSTQQDGWIERWKLDVSPMWHVEVEGISPAHHQQQGNWLPEYLPWPGDKVDLEITRPEGLPGNVLTVVGSDLTVKPGKRATDTRLELKTRTSQGGRYEIKLPLQAQLQTVRVNGRSQPIRQEGRQVSLPLRPGEQKFELNWREPGGIEAGWNTPIVDLGQPSVNARTKVVLARDRWALFVSGPPLGPAVLFWGEVLVLLGIAVALGRMNAQTPLGTVSWFLLGIGLSQVSPVLAILVVGTLLALGYRNDLDTSRIKSFNLMQIGLAALVVIGTASLLWAVKQGLLGLPRMQIAGNNSWGHELNWYQDRADSLLPQASVISLPLSVYRGLMLAWALWLALSVLKWSQWGWSAFTQGERWRHDKFSLPKRKLFSK